MLMEGEGSVSYLEDVGAAADDVDAACLGTRDACAGSRANTAIDDWRAAAAYVSSPVSELTILMPRLPRAVSTPTL